MKTLVHFLSVFFSSVSSVYTEKWRFCAPSNSSTCTFLGDFKHEVKSNIFK